MQTQEKRNRRRIKTTLGVTGALVGATLTGAALLGAGPQHAQETVQARSTEFPFATLRSTQRMRLNVANVTANPPNDTPPPCRVLFRLFDSEGRVVATATSMLESGKTAQITADSPDTVNPPDTTPARIPGMRGQLLVREGRCSDAVLGSMEIIDTASGEVRAVIAPATSRRVPVTQNPPDTTPQ